MSRTYREWASRDRHSAAALFALGIIVLLFYVGFSAWHGDLLSHVSAWVSLAFFFGGGALNIHSARKWDRRAAQRAVIEECRASGEWW